MQANYKVHYKQEKGTVGWEELPLATSVLNE